ncbi:hypothetical protein [Nannocystis radixulma]|uniref:Uncharacterized protein n=1 Tax=Nannocystis radixulma TaxID=2995305 RepID=A0ABT5B4D6_9BACT|nr:hypothetical protein [Nannocystis radixulma]MDC0668956.1 hypothetical protein [Nannocystis radixulma]
MPPGAAAGPATNFGRAPFGGPADVRKAAHPVTGITVRGLLA